MAIKCRTRIPVTRILWLEFKMGRLLLLFSNMDYHWPSSGETLSREASVRMR